MRRPILFGNWKLNHRHKDLTAFTAEFKSLMSSREPECDFGFAPVATLLSEATRSFKGSGASIAAQDIHSFASGAFTGTISAEHAVDAGAQFVIIGHSERRAYFAEDDTSVNAKVRRALSVGLTPIVCVGEPLSIRDAGGHEKFVKSQVTSALQDLSSDEASTIVIAYEPVWAIGTGKSATPEMAQEMHAAIRETLSSLFGRSAAEKVRIQYGGSVKASNAAELMAMPDIDGALVGGASLRADSFVAILDALN